MPKNEQSPFEPLDSPAPWIEAGFEGVCSRDFDTIYEGDIIRSDGEGGWERKECVEEDEDWNESYPSVLEESYSDDNWYGII